MTPKSFVKYSIVIAVIIFTGLKIINNFVIYPYSLMIVIIMAAVPTLLHWLIKHPKCEVCGSRRGYLYLHDDPEDDVFIIYRVCNHGDQVRL